DRYRPGHVVHADHRQTAPAGPVQQGGYVLVVPQVLVPVGDHRTAAVPPPPADDVHLLGGERVRRAHHRADVEVSPPVLDRHVERVPPGVQVGDDRLQAPVPVLVDDVAPVAGGEQLGVEPVVVGPGLRATGPGPDPHDL